MDKRMVNNEQEMDDLIQAMKLTQPTGTIQLIGTSFIKLDNKKRVLKLTAIHTLFYKWPNGELSHFQEAILDSDLSYDEVLKSSSILEAKIKEMTRSNLAYSYGLYLIAKYNKGIGRFIHEQYTQRNSELPLTKKGLDYTEREFFQLLREMELLNKEAIKQDAGIWENFNQEYHGVRPPSPTNPFISN